MPQLKVAHIPKWAENCPVAYGEYRDAVLQFEEEFNAARVSKKLVKRIGVAMAIAWSKGQDSVKEIEAVTENFT